MAAPWEALDESCTGPDLVARNLAQAATKRQSAGFLDGFRMSESHLEAGPGPRNHVE